jgi:hypothetical protein
MWSCSLQKHDFSKIIFFPAEKAVNLSICQHYHYWLFAALVAFITTALEFDVFIPVCWLTMHHVFTIFLQYFHYPCSEYK